MAILPGSSPSIAVKEIDLTGVVPAVTTSTGAFVGDFRWGPVEEPILVSNESNLVSNFGSPDQNSAVDFLSASAFLQYSDSLYVVREVTSTARNASSADSAAAAPLVKNMDNWNAQKGNLATEGLTFVSKYPGTAGNSIKVEVCPYSASDAVFEAWGDSAYSGYFDGAPSTSTYVGEQGGNNDEVHVLVIDENGAFSGTRGSVLESFAFASLASDAKTSDGTANYLIDVLNNRSQYVWCASAPEALDAGIPALGKNFIMTTPAVQEVSLVHGVESGVLDTSEILLGFDQFQDVNTIEVDFLIAPGMADKEKQLAVVARLVSIAAGTNGRMDCVVVTSPDRAAVVYNPSPVSSTLSTTNDFNGSSYLIVDNNYLKVYDKYNDQYVFIPAAPVTAGVMAGTDAVAAPWFSPAGSRRGQYFGVTSLAYNATKSERDSLYKAGVNPVINVPGQGIILFGDKTKESRPSAFDRINVRRLFLAVERSIKGAARNVMFEFNDEFTRAEFVNVVVPFLREIKGRRGITDFRVVCDETNNTAAVIDQNRFVANIFIKPARSINYVTLNFVAVRTGVEFEEVVGSV